MVVQCCVCKKIRHEGRWISADTHRLNGSRVSHSYCPECALHAFTEFHSWRREFERLQHEEAGFGHCCSG